MPKGSAPIVVVQHISAEFMRSFGRHLSITSGLKLVLVNETVPLEPDSLYMTVGDSHLVLKDLQGRLYVAVSNVEPRNGHRPSIDLLFESAVPAAEKLAAILLTGMGKDGAKGLLSLRTAGAFTMAQDEQSCVVYGMPKEAQLLGAPIVEGDPHLLRRTLDELQAGQRHLTADPLASRFLKAR
jgi:two-component system chemotaxis response regulator CheB